MTAVNGATLTLQMTMPQGFMMMRRHYSPSVTPTITPASTPTPKTLTIMLTSSTKYTGGSESDITVNTKVAGVGTLGSDGSLTATQVTINPTFPTGFPQK